MVTDEPIRSESPARGRHSSMAKLMAVLNKQRGERDAEEKFRNQLKWLKWLAATAIGIFIAGFAAAQFMSGFAQDDEVEDLEKRLETIEATASTLANNQETMAARQALIDTRIELLLILSGKPPIKYQERKELKTKKSILQEKIAEQEKIVEEVEAASAPSP